MLALPFSHQAHRDQSKFPLLKIFLARSNFDVVSKLRNAFKFSLVCLSLPAFVGLALAHKSTMCQTLAS